MRIVDRGAKVVVIGDDDDADRIGTMLVDMLAAVRRGHTPTLEDINRALDRRGCPKRAAAEDPAADRSPALRPDIRVQPRTDGQKEYLDAIRDHEMTFAIGPAGTGKTYLAMAAAVSALLSKRVERLVLTRPAVEAGESLGFLPGDLEQKVNPYLRPLYDALYSMVDLDRVRRFIDHQRIEVAPLAYMRGRSLDHAFVILDEAQNTTTDQMLMFITRLGQGSRAVITGDVTQIDLPRGSISGLVEGVRILGRVEGIGVVNLSKRDVVRNPIVQRIVDAYEADSARSARQEAAVKERGESPC